MTIPQPDRDRNHRQRVEDAIAALELMQSLELNPRELTPQARDQLLLFPGFGAIARIFDDSQAPVWEQQAREQLRSLLSPEEYASARNSILTAYYTPADIIEVMWSAAESLGYEGGLVLDPGCGATANFISYCPEKLRSLARFVGVEIDPFSCRMARLLHPEQSFYNRSIVDMPYPVNQFDWAIGNIPFANGVFDKYNGFRWKVELHARIFMKTIDLLKPGGFAMLITSTGTLDSNGKHGEYNKFREWMDVRSVFLGAVRLPCQAFQSSYNTSVTTDLVLLQKRFPDDDRRSQPWLNTSPTTLVSRKDNQPIDLNEYYYYNPDHLLGDPVIDRLTGDKYAVSLPQGANLIEMLQKNLQDIVWKSRQKHPEPVSIVQSSIQMSTQTETIKETSMFATSPVQEPESMSWQDFLVSHNQRKNLIEVRFPAKPPKTITNELENAGFRFYERNSELNGERDNRWCKRSLADAWLWVQAFANRFDIELDIPKGMEIDAEAVPTSPTISLVRPLAGATFPTTYEVSAVAVDTAPVEPTELEETLPPEPTEEKHKKQKRPASTTDIFSLFDQMAAQAAAIVEQVEEAEQQRNLLRQEMLADMKAKLNLKFENPVACWLLVLGLQATAAMVVQALAIQIAQSSSQVEPQTTAPSYTGERLGKQPLKEPTSN